MEKLSVRKTILGKERRSFYTKDIFNSLFYFQTYPPPPPPPPPGGGVNVFIPSFDLLTTEENRLAMESDKEFPDAVATACRDSAVTSPPPMTRHDREEISSSFWASVISAKLVIAMVKLVYLLFARLTVLLLEISISKL